MTQNEKITAILEKLKDKQIDLKPEMIPVLMIIGYLTKLKNLGFIDIPYQSTDSGEDVISICSEYDYKPSDLDIKQFVQDMVDNPQIQPEFILILLEFRDNPEKLIKEFNEFKDTGSIE